MIIAAAYRLFVERGFAEVSLEQIAEAGGVSRRTIYNKFVSKAHLYRAVFEPVLDLLEKDAPVRSMSGSDPRELLHSYAASLSALMRRAEMIDLLRVLVFDAESQPWLAQVFVERLRRPIRAAFVEDIERLMAMDKLPNQDARMLSEQFFATTLGLLAFPQLLQFKPERSTDDLDEILRSTVDSLLVAWKVAA